MTFDLQLWVTSPSTYSVRGRCSDIKCVSGGRAKPRRSFYCFADSKVLRSTDLVLRSFFFFKSMECVCGHKKIKIYVGKCMGGEVGGFKHLHVETKQPNRASWTSPPPR